MNKYARATALLPAYRAEGFIKATLDSLSAQTYKNFNVIVSIDVCEDDTYAVCAAHAARDSRFRVLRQDRRQGYVGNCNFLLDQADADYVFFAFHDDIVVPAYVEKLCAALDAHPEAILAYSDVLVTDEERGTRGDWSFTALDGLHDPVARGRQMMKMPGRWPAPNRGLFRLRRARRIGGLRNHGAGGYAPDFPWLVHMSLLGEFVRVPETLVHKFYKTGSLSKTWAGSAAQTNAALAAGLREVWLSELTLRHKLQITVAFKWVVRARLQDLILSRR